MTADKRRAALRIGTSGYQYDHWRGVFYPHHLPKRRWFEYYAHHFDTVEINSTFYRLPPAKTFDGWRERAPAGFCYALKLSRYATHQKRLKDPRGPVAEFLRRARRLDRFLGPILVQLPPRWHVNVERLAAFMDAAPAEQRWAVEFRDPSWLCDEVYALLRGHAAALCIHDMIDRHPRELTADWAYMRFHGLAYDQGYSRQALAAQAGYVKEYLADGIDVFAYFNNDRQGHAVRNARDLRRYVEGR